MPEDEQDPPAWLAPLWQAALRDWANEALHRAILAHCDSPERLSEVARRYRRALEDPGRGPVAKRQLDAIVGLAFAQLTPRSSPPMSRTTWHWVWLLLLLAGVVALASRL